MRSIKARFRELEYKYPDYSSFIVFCETVKGQNYSRDRLQRAFASCVEKDDYIGSSKNTLLKHLYALSEEKIIARSVRNFEKN